jgi:hypothetical protein
MKTLKRKDDDTTGINVVPKKKTKYIKVQVLVSHNLAVVFARPKKENIMLCATFVWLCP